MKKVYLDNAATTPIDPEVIEVMTQVLKEDFGNPSSTHSFGRHAKNRLELSRKTIAKALNCSAQEIIFTSGGTEAINWVLRSVVSDLNVKRIVSSKIEHHAVLHTLEALEKEFPIRIDYVTILPNGDIDTTHLVELLSDSVPTLVTLMHVNNEIGNELNIERIARICKQHQVYFHTDTVQSIGKTTLDLQQIPIDFLAASAHKFHGPKGVGFAFVRKGIVLQPLFHGGEQEKGLRSGTESVHNIVGMAKALELSLNALEQHKETIIALKKYTIEQFQNHFSDFKINGNLDGFYNIINILLPFSEDKAAMLLFHLDMKGIAISRGSACQSGSSKPSHVLAEFLNEFDSKKPSVRISFSHFNSKEDVDCLVSELKSFG